MSALATGVSPEQQGVLQGSISSLRVLSKAIGGPLFGAVLAYSLKEGGGEEGEEGGGKVGWSVGMPFMVAGALDFLAAVVCWYVFRKYGNLKGEGGREGGVDDMDMMMVLKKTPVVSARKGGKAGSADLEAGDGLMVPLKVGRGESATTCSMEDEDTAHSSGISSLAGTDDEEEGEEGSEGEEEGGREGRVLLFGTLECDALNPMSPL